MLFLWRWFRKREKKYDNSPSTDLDSVLINTDHGGFTCLKNQKVNITDVQSTNVIYFEAGLVEVFKGSEAVNAEFMMLIDMANKMGGGWLA